MSALAAIHVAKKQLGLDDDTYRAVLVRVTGKDSAGKMTEAERLRVVEELRGRGFKKTSKRPQKDLQGPFAGKLQALWISAWNLGLVRDRRDAALLAFVERQSGISHTRFLIDADDARKAIEALKGWMAREGAVDWTVKKTLPPAMNEERFRVAWAQFRLLLPGATYVGNLADFKITIAQILGQPVDLPLITPSQWHSVMNTLGERIRKARG